MLNVLLLSVYKEKITEDVYGHRYADTNTDERTKGIAHRFLACRSRQASIVLERYFRFEVSLLSFYACERDGPI